MSTVEAPPAPRSQPAPTPAPASSPRRPSLWKSRWLSLILLSADAAGLSVAWMGAYYLRALLNPVMGPINDSTPYLQLHPAIVLAGLANCVAFGLYLHRRRLSSLNRAGTILRASYHWLLYIVVIAFFFKELDLGRSVIVMGGLLGVLYLYGSRTILKSLKAKALRQGRGTVRAAIIGQGALADEVRGSLHEHPEIGYSFAGMVLHLPEGEASSEVPADVPVLGYSRDIAAIVERHGIEELFLAVPHLDPQEQLNLLNLADNRGLNVHVVSDIFGVITEQAKVEEISTFPVITLRDGYMPMHQAIMKRALDLACAIGGIAVWLLFFHWWISWRIRRDSAGPVFFMQDRVGQHGQTFRIYKYRTMRTDAEAYAVAPTADSDPRITRFGAWLRKTSLDELPQLLNVLRGEMSMVGPRPEMPFIVQGYEAWQRRRLDFKPGVTGLWQVVGRKNLPLHLNMQYDFYYIKNQSFLMDVEILFKTVPAVLKGRGAF